MLEFSWIYSRLKSCLVHDLSWASLTEKSHTFPPFMSFSSGTVFVVRNFPCPWICPHEALFAAIVLPILYCSILFCVLSYHDFSITLSFFFSAITWFCEILPEVFHFFPHPHFVYLFPSELILLMMSSLLIEVSYSLVHLLLLGDCYLIFVMPRNSLMWVWTVETYFFFCQGYLLHMQDEIHLFFRELSAVSW